MFLKSIDIFGFKSFADKTHIDFVDGISALVGPNGCGKSNVVDAIKWALGEQAARAMRAESMGDVIFNGTEVRKALGVAEVTLTLANETSLLPLDMTEVEIKRRLYRSGESEYLVNGEQKRLKEIRELFWDTGIGKGAYSVMEQGRIDQVLSSKPEERRYLFEEAAGITKIKVKNAEAARNLARVEENIQQEEGILKEIKHSYDTLKTQTEKTLLYRKLKDTAFSAELDIQLLRIKAARDSAVSLKNGIKDKTAERDKAQAELDAIHNAVSSNMDLVTELEAQLSEAQKTLVGLQMEKNKHEAAAVHLTTSRAEIKTQIEVSEGKARTLKSRIEEQEDDIAEQREEISKSRAKLAQVNDNIKSFEENIKTAASQLNANERTIKERQGGILDFERSQRENERELEKITDDIVLALDTGLKSAGYSAAERKSTETAIREQFSKLSIMLTGRKTIISDYAKLEKPLTDEDAAKITASFDETLSTIEELRASFEKYASLVPAFIDEFLAPEGIITQKRALDAKIRAAKDGIAGCNEEIRAVRLKNEELSVKISEYRATLEKLRMNMAEMEAESRGSEERVRLVERQLAEQKHSLKTLEDETFLLKKRFEEVNDKITETEEEIASIDAEGHKLSADLEKLEKDIQRRSADVSGKQAEIDKKRDALARINQEVVRLDLAREQAENEVVNIGEAFRDNHGRDIMEFEERIFKIEADQSALRETLRNAKQEMSSLGQVNFMAPEEFAEVKDRFELHSNQMADMKTALANLEKITAQMRAESSAKFIGAYNKIKRNFHNMFRRLFGGGRAELRLSDSKHVLESGIEIYAQPPGKKLENITLLSGGERSMTAVALLFATYMVKPSPFCLLDEIDAALDDANVSRFVQILREFSKTSQFLVITHNKDTMVGAGTLLGVSMSTDDPGVTRLLSVRTTGAEEAARNAALAEAARESENFVEEDVEPETLAPETVDDDEGGADGEGAPEEGELLI